MCALHSSLPGKQSGVALLAFIIIVALVTVAYYVDTVSTQQVQIDRQQKTRMALKQARAALLAYAMNYPDIVAAPDEGPGKMPCPDTDNDGISDLGCNALLESPGRLPWLTLGIEELRDGNNERLWYAVSRNFGTAGVTTINTATEGTISYRDANGVLLNDGAGADGVLAVIISPGAALLREDNVAQARATAVQQNNPVNYLDIAFFNTANEEDNVSFLNGDSNNGLIGGSIRDAAGTVIVNDIVEVITYEDLATLMHARVASDLADAINAYAAPANCNSWPEAITFDATRAPGNYLMQPGILQGQVAVDDPDWQLGGCADGLLPQWFEAEEWHLHSWYALASTAACTPGVDCLSSEAGAAGSFDKQAVLVFSGRHGLAGPSNNPSDYFEGQNDNSVIDSIFDIADPTPGADDSVWVLAP